MSLVPSRERSLGVISGASRLLIRACLFVVSTELIFPPVLASALAKGLSLAEFQQARA